jgi:hypothetical protein
VPDWIRPIVKAALRQSTITATARASRVTNIRRIKTNHSIVNRTLPDTFGLRSVKFVKSSASSESDLPIECHLEVSLLRNCPGKNTEISTK